MSSVEILPRFGAIEDQLVFRKVTEPLKLDSHPDLLRRLLAGGDALLVEDSSSHGRRANNLFCGAVRMLVSAASLDHS